MALRCHEVMGRTGGMTQNTSGLGKECVVSTPSVHSCQMRVEHFKVSGHCRAGHTVPNFPTIHACLGRHPLKNNKNTQLCLWQTACTLGGQWRTRSASYAPPALRGAHRDMSRRVSVCVCVRACRYGATLGRVGTTSMACTSLTHADHVVAGQSMSFAILVAACIQVLP